REGLAKELPEGIEIEFDEEFDAMFSYKAKNYALLTKDGDVIMKGGALKSRGLEKFQRVFLEEMIKLIMKGKPEAITNLRDEFEPENRDENVDYYVAKLDDLMKKFGGLTVAAASTAKQENLAL